MSNPLIWGPSQRAYSLGATLSTAVAGTAVGVKPRGSTMTSVITIASGSARSVSLQGSLDGTNWFDIGTTRTATGTFVEVVPALPRYRLNMASTTSSTATGSIYG